MEELLAKSDAAVAEHDVEEVVDIDFQFHNTFGKAARNLFLLEFQEILLRLLGRYVYLGFQVEGNPEGAISDHRAILAALRAHDPDACEVAMRSHIHNGRERMRKAL
jgi:DNA-binding GntR family transcriptional regulator